MALWVVKDASCRSKTGSFSGRCVLGAPSRQGPCPSGAGTVFFSLSLRERVGVRGSKSSTPHPTFSLSEKGLPDFVVVVLYGIGYVSI